MNNRRSVLPIVLSLLCAAPTAAIAAPPTSTQVPAPPSGDSARAQAATAYSGQGLTDAGIYFTTYGSMAVIMSSIYSKCGSTDTAGVCAPGIGLGLAVGGLVNVVVGLPLAVAGLKRGKDPAAWMAKRPHRHARMLAKAEAKGIEALPAGGTPRIDKGRRQSRAGSFTLIGAGITLGLGVGVAPLLPRAGIGLNVAGLGLLATGVGLAVAGKRRTFIAPQGRRAATFSLAPTLVTSPGQRTLAGAGVSGRF